MPMIRSAPSTMGLGQGPAPVGRRSIPRAPSPRAPRPGHRPVGQIRRWRDARPTTPRPGRTAARSARRTGRPPSGNGRCWRCRRRGREPGECTRRPSIPLDDPDGRTVVADIALSTGPGAYAHRGGGEAPGGRGPTTPPAGRDPAAPTERQEEVVPTNADIVRTVTEALGRGDLLAVMGLVSKDVRWAVNAADREAAPWFRVYQGKRSLPGLLRRAGPGHLLRLHAESHGVRRGPGHHLAACGLHQPEGAGGGHGGGPDLAAGRRQGPVSVDTLLDTAAVGAAFA